MWPFCVCVVKDVIGSLLFRMFHFIRITQYDRLGVAGLGCVAVLWTLLFCGAAGKYIISSNIKPIYKIRKFKLLTKHSHIGLVSTVSGVADYPYISLNTWYRGHCIDKGPFRFGWTAGHCVIIRTVLPCTGISSIKIWRHITIILYIPTDFRMEPLL